MDELAVEIEAKFAVDRLDPIRRRLLDQSARLILPRLRETNMRFDEPDGRLQRDGRVLRLRTSHDTRLTYKAPGPNPEERQEVELAVDDAVAARQLLEGLGYQIVFIYEKYREVYSLESTRVMLDELPFATFVEVEADDLASVRRTAEAIGLSWPARIALGYLGLFQRLRQRHGWPFRDATFANFVGRPALVLEEVLEAAGQR